MLSFATLNNIIILPKKELTNNLYIISDRASDRVLYKVFGINYLTNLICDRTLNILKTKYRPPKKYLSDLPLINKLNNEYYEEQLF